MSVLACPQCTNPITDGRCAECGLDSSLLVQVRRSAERLARRAAQEAAAGEWQKAYDNAAESLRLSRRSNDLAAFVLLSATVAGAQGSVAMIPLPLASALPASLAGLLDDVLAMAGRLRRLSENASSPSEIETVLQELDPQHALLPPPPAHRPQRLSPLGVTAAGLALVAGLAGGWWNGERTTRQRMEARLATVSRPPPVSSSTPAPEPAPAPAPTPAPEPWVNALQSLPSLKEGLGAQAWRRGRNASRDGRYDEARQFLEVAVQTSKTSWYWPHALYYLGKSYHRLGRRDDAMAAYRRLEREAPDSEYVPEVRRLLARLDRGEGVDH